MFFPEAARYLSAPILLPDSTLEITGASIDTRTLVPGNLFVAIRGVKDDGHRFLETAFQKGASGALVDQNFVGKGLSEKLRPGGLRNLIPVKNTSEAFLRLASFYRNSFHLRHVIGVVGSVGKTSTKEFLAYLLRKSFSTLATQGNLNNHLGLPLTLFQLRSDHDVCLCELGTNQPGDVKQLAEVLKPSCGLLTRIAPEHMAGFKTMDRVYDAELELFEQMPARAPAIIPGGDTILREKIKKLSMKWIFVGPEEGTDYLLSDVEGRDGWIRFKLNGKSFAFLGLAPFLASNAALAIAAAEICGIPLSKIPSVWEDFKLPDGRFQPKILPNGSMLIFDGYNASPASFEAALESLKSLAVKGRKVLAISDMLELGENEKTYHEELGEKIAKAKPDYVVAYGPRSKWVIQSLSHSDSKVSTDYVENSLEAAEKLHKYISKDDCILLKASRGMKIEDIIVHMNRWGEEVLRP